MFHKKFDMEVMENAKQKRELIVEEESHLPA